MPKFSANLSFLFPEVPFLERFGEAARAGFRAVEFGFAYDTPEREIAARLAEHGLACVLINAPPGDLGAGERGIASLPGRERGVRREHRYRASLCRCARLPAHSRAVGRRSSRRGRRAAGASRDRRCVRNLRAACTTARRARRDVARRSAQPARCARLFLFDAGRRACDSRRRGCRESQGAAGLLSRANRRRATSRRSSSAGCLISGTFRSRACRGGTNRM